MSQIYSHGLYEGDSPSIDLTALVYATLAPFENQESLQGTEAQRALGVILSQAREYLKALKEPVGEWSLQRARAFALIGPSEIPGLHGSLGQDTLRDLFKTATSAEGASALPVILAASELLRQWGEYPPDGILPQDHAAVGNTIRERLHAAVNRKDGEFGKEGAWSGDLPFWSQGASLTAGVLSELSAWRDIRPEEEQTLERSLMASFDSADGWGSTVETAAVLQRLKDYFGARQGGANEIPSCPAGGSVGIDTTAIPCSCEQDTLRCVVEGQSLGDLQAAEGTIELPAVPSSYQLVAHIQREGKPGEAPAVMGPLVVERTLLRVVGGGKTEEVSPSTVLRRGDTVVSVVHFSDTPIAHRRWRVRAASSFMIATDSIPSIAVAVDDERQALADAGLATAADSSVGHDYWRSIRETRRFPWHIERVFELPRWEFIGKPRTIYSAWKVLYTGRATLPPARVTDMYNGERFGLATGGVHEVVAE